MMSAPVRVVGLKVDYLDRPLGLDNPYPRFSWQLESGERNVWQSGYRILVASSEEALDAGRGDVWDSGRVDSGRSLDVKYTGQPLSSRERYWWRVQVWDRKGRESAPSVSSWWEMGLLDRRDWVAQWLAAEDLVAKADRETGLSWIWGQPVLDDLRPRKFRYKFSVPVPVCGGELFARANGWFGRITGVWVDGTAVTTTAPDKSPEEWLGFQRMGAGEHLIAVVVEPLAPPSFASKIVRPDAFTSFARLNLENGDTIRIGTGPDWKTSVSEDPDWHSPGYRDEEWEMAQLSRIAGYEPWPARPAMYLRRDILIREPVRRARLYVTALGAYEVRLNGRRVGNALLTPEPSQYSERVQYRVFDVKDGLWHGRNALGLIVGDGWYGSAEGRFEWGPPPRRVLAQLELVFDSGTRQIVGTGPGWRIEEGPIRSSEIRTGEIYDARLEKSGWDTPAFNHSRWPEAEIALAPLCRIVAQVSPPIRATEILTPLKISQPNPGIHVFDFGRNFAGWCRLHAKGAEGTRLELRFAEVLNSSGEVERSHNLSMGEPKRDIFVLRGEPGGETFEPRFTYRGFRYVQVTGLLEEPTRDSIQGVVVRSDLDLTGMLRVDDPLIEAIWQATVRTQCSNFVGIPTDCPSREQRGWLADCGNFWDAAAFNMDVCSFTSRQMDNIVDGQLGDGAFPQLAPWPSKFLSGIAGPPAWADSAVILPWIVWQRYGDTAIIERNWDAMNRYLEFIFNNNPDFLWKHERSADYGDWLAPDQLTFDPLSSSATPKELVATAYWAHSADLLAQMAQAIGRTSDATRLMQTFERIRRAFIEAYVTPDGVVGNGSQTSHVLALKFGLLPDDIRSRAAELLAADVRQRGVAVATGFLGTQFILDVLADEGFTALAYSLLLRTEYPSWGYMLREGATTIWESWSGEIEYENKKVKVSQNHFDLGSVCGFLFRRIAGIDAGAPGFNIIVVRPAVDSRVKRGGGDYHSIIGLISTEWRQASDHSFMLDVAIPANAMARIFLPTPRGSYIEERGEDISNKDGIVMVDRSEDTAVIEVGSGQYSFLVRQS